MGGLGDRMKANYEDRNRIYLTRRTPVILRLDGRCFHTLTRSCDRPFDKALRNSLTLSAVDLLKETMGGVLAYCQSDEISVLLIDFKRLTSEAWFDYNVQKMCSVAASIMTSGFGGRFGRAGTFDCRAFNIPKEEVVNYFIWRQRDWERNSLQMLARSHFSHKQLNLKKAPDIHDMLHEINVNWAHLESCWKNGDTIYHNEDGDIVRNTEFLFVDERDTVDAMMLPLEATDA